MNRDVFTSCEHFRSLDKREENNFTHPPKLPSIQTLIEEISKPHVENASGEINELRFYSKPKEKLDQNNHVIDEVVRVGNMVSCNKKVVNYYGYLQCMSSLLC